MLPVIPHREAFWVCLCLLAVSKLDFESAKINEKIVQAAPRPFVEPLFSHPLPWTAKVTQSGPGIHEVRTRYYVPKETK